MGRQLLKGKLRLNRPFNQNFIMGCVLAGLPGIYLALTGLGAGGGQPSSQHVAALTNSILYGLFTLFGWLAGTVLNFLGPKITTCIGGLGYPVYAASLWAFDQGVAQGFPLFGGAFLGFSAALLWTSAGFIQFAYAEEKEKAKFITYQWALSAVGGTIGSLIAFIVNVHKTAAGGASAAVYIIFIVIMCSSIVAAAFLIKSPKIIVRDDGRHISIFKKPTLREEMAGLFAMMTDLKVILFLPALFTGEMILSLSSSMNGYYFNLRTRSLNNLLFNLIMIPSPLVLAWIMDHPRIKSRRMRGIAGTATIGIIAITALVGTLAWIIHNDVDRNKTPPGADWTDSSTHGFFVLMLLYGILDGNFQLVVQWTLSALSNDPVMCARYAGLFKGTVSLGLCTAFTMDAKAVSYETQNIVQICVYAVGIASMCYVILKYVKDTNYFLEENVIVPASVEEEAIITGAVPVEVIEHEHEKLKLAKASVLGEGGFEEEKKTSAV